MKRIIFFSKNLNIGGMEKALVNLLNALASEYEITLVLEEKCGPLLDNLKNNIKVEEYKLSKIKVAPLRKAINLFKRILWSIKNKNNYDFSCNYATYSIIGSRLSQIASKNSALYVHSDYYNYFKKNEDNIKNFFNQLKFNKFKNIVFVSNESYKNIIKVIPQIKSKATVINNLYNIKDILELSLQKKDLTAFKSNNFNLLFVGRLDNTSKNFDLLVDSFALAKKNRENLHLFIIGNGPYLVNIKKMIKDYNIENSITLLGEKKNPYPYMKACDALVLTSRYEGFPVIYLEALCLNKKVLTTIPVSDECINIRNFFTILKQDKKYIANIFTNIEKETVNYNINYNDINDFNFKKFKMLIEGRINNNE